ncbi:hypothetical protein KXQ82_15440 [Mucilaginibacter sp. HMF5004]|uniref:hypothetical protein n=1 Tax=Mucilaginibacter rivuli TaxID=2857527 RepID=UPI001C5F6FAF|nr:hypothetical protein [Mucilaginibacter rivuli]MBW4891118.1 hypothetical protein [Mucilaginibacter rivuli]
MNLILKPSIIDHWQSQVEDLQLSSEAFYKEITDTLDRKAYPNVIYERTALNQGGFFSAKRDYLKVAWGEYEFLICAAPFGADFFFSWYIKKCMSTGALLEPIPFIGKWLYRMSLRKSYYEYDTETMFMGSIKKVVENIMAKVAQDKGLRIGQREAATA